MPRIVVGPPTDWRDRWCWQNLLGDAGEIKQNTAAEETSGLRWQINARHAGGSDADLRAFVGR